MWLVLVSSRVVSPRMLLFLQCPGFEPKIFYGRKTLKEMKATNVNGGEESRTRDPTLA